MAETNGNYNFHDQKLNLSFSSTNTISEMKIGKNPFFKLFYIFSTFIYSLLGFYLIFKFNELLRYTNNYNLLIYLILYTFKWPFAFLLGVLLAFVIILFKKIKNSEHSDENTPNYIGHIFVCFIYNLVIIYISSVFWSLYLFVKLLDKDSNEYKVNYREKFELIYIFITLNFIISFIIFSIFCYFLLMANLPFKTNEERENIDEEFIKKVREEINAVNKISGTLQVDKELKLNKEFLIKEFDSKSFNFGISDNNSDKLNNAYSISKTDRNTFINSKK